MVEFRLRPHDEVRPRPDGPLDLLDEREGISTVTVVGERRESIEESFGASHAAFVPDQLEGLTCEFAHQCHPHAASLATMRYRKNTRLGQVGPDLAGLLDFYDREVRPRL